MPARDVASAVRDAINTTAGQDIQANIGDAQRRVDLTHTSLLPTAIDFSEDTGGGVSLELPIGDFSNDIVKQHGDMLRIINHLCRP